MRRLIGRPAKRPEKLSGYINKMLLKHRLFETINCAHVLVLMGLKMDYRAFYELMEEEGRKIDPDKAILIKPVVNVADPYGLGDTKLSCFDRLYFVSNPDGPWVFSGDVPDDIWQGVMKKPPSHWDEVPF